MAVGERNHTHSPSGPIVFPEIFSSRYLSIPKDIGAGDMPLPPINIDPPEHTRIRRLLLPFFSPGRVTALEPATRAIVRELLDAIAGSNTDPGGRGHVVEFDASARITKPLPVKVTERLLGTPAEDAPRFSAWIRSERPVASSSSRFWMIAPGFAAIIAASAADSPSNCSSATRRLRRPIR